MSPPTTAVYITKCTSYPLELSLLRSDLNSSNGTWENGKQEMKAELPVEPRMTK